MNYELSLTSSDFLQENFFTAEDVATEYVELPIYSRFNQFYKIKRFGRWFLLKGLRKEYASEAMYVSLLKKEFDLSVELDHPNIVTTILKEDNPKVGPAILMEYIDGMRLDEFLATNPTEKQRRKLVDQLLDAMHYFHSKQIVHRDLKPGNLLVTHNGHNLKVIDFGLADADSYAVFKQPAGTKSYAAPEQLELGRAVDCRADIYSFGLILREIFPKRYRSVAGRCVQSEPARRYADVVEVMKAIERRDGLRRALLPLILSLLFVVTLVVGVANYLGSGSAEATYSNPQQELLDDAFAGVDAIYEGYMDSLRSGQFEYREFATLALAEKVKIHTNLMQQYLQTIAEDTPFYGDFMASFTGYCANNYYYEATEMCEALPSFFTEHSEGRISEEEFQQLYDEYNRQINVQ